MLYLRKLRVPFNRSVEILHLPQKFQKSPFIRVKQKKLRLQILTSKNRSIAIYQIQISVFVSTGDKLAT